MKEESKRGRVLPIGKLDTAILRTLVLDKIRKIRPELVLGPGVGEDCAIVTCTDEELVVSTDPITASVRDIGRLAVHISANDVASDGIEPVAITLCVMLPYGTTEEDLAHISDDMVEAAEEVRVQIVGGHTEVTGAVRQPVVISTCFGFAERGKTARATDMRAGDIFLLTKSAGLEGTGILCSDRRESLATVLTEAEIRLGIAMLKQVSVVKEGLIAGKIGTSGMHDVTEGGVLSAIWEMCAISGLGADIREEAIPVSDLTKKVAAHYGIDWKRLISSGCLLIAARPEKAEQIRKAIEAESIPCTPIGRVQGRGDEGGIDEKAGKDAHRSAYLSTDENGKRDPVIYLRKQDGKRVRIQPPTSDELYKVLKRT